MVTSIITDTQLRSSWPLHKEKILYVTAGSIFTPSALDYVRENQIEVRFCPKKTEIDAMPVDTASMQGDRCKYVDGTTGAHLDVKPEDMTHLYGNVLVHKSHPRIRFRGCLDSLMARVLQVQLEADRECPPICEHLEEVLLLLRKMMAADVKNESLDEFVLLGLDSQALRNASHNIKSQLGISHPTPHHSMGRLCIELNSLRTQVRQCELQAVEAFSENGQCTRSDFVEALNRLSSCIYLIMCRKLAGYYDYGRNK